LFSKTTWAICGLDTESLDAFKTIVDAGHPDIDFNPLRLFNTLQTKGGSGVGLSTFSQPFNPNEDNSLEDCELSEGVYGLWVILLEDVTLRDPRVLQEHLSYTTYGTPFKFLPKEQKQDIVDMLGQEERQISMVHVPVILDFNRGQLWTSTTNKGVLEEVRGIFEKLGVETSMMTIDFGTNDWPRQVLEKVAAGEIFQDEFLARAEEVKSCGNPKAVEPHEDAVIERLLKKFYRCAEIDGYHVFLGTPSKLSLTNQLNTVSANTPWDCFEILNQGLGVASGRITISERGAEGNFFDRFSIEVSDSTHLDPGFIVFKGLENHELNHEIKQTGLANGRLTIKDYWATDYQCNVSAVAQFINLVKDILELTGDYGIKLADSGEEDI
jgi:hypothetical protein